MSSASLRIRSIGAARPRAHQLSGVWIAPLRSQTRGFRLWNYLSSKQLQKLSADEVTVARDDRERVVILGSGWAGYNLARGLDHSKFQAIVVSPRSYFVFTPLLASTAVGTLEFRTALEPVRSGNTQAGFIQGWADGVDFLNKRITVEEAVDDPRLGLAPTGQKYVEISTGEAVEVRKGKTFEMDYDKLVVAVGCYSQTFNIPGVREHALFLKDVGDARRIRKRIIACFENASLPTMSVRMKKNLLNFAIVGGGPTGIEFSAELHDFISEDLAKTYPDLMKYYNIAVYDVAPTVLPMFDKSLGEYAMKHFAREGISIKTSHHIQKLKPGVPQDPEDPRAELDPKDEHHCLTLEVKEEGEIGVGMVVWSTGLMQNPFVKNALGKTQHIVPEDVDGQIVQGKSVDELEWKVKSDAKTGSIATDKDLRLIVQPKGSEDGEGAVALKDVFAIGDCSTIETAAYPATAQVASQKADYLARSLNRGSIGTSASAGFSFNNLGVMAYIGNWNAIFQGGGGGNVSGRTAWFIWRGAYLTKSVSWRNKVLIPMYWFLNWAFGRDISRF